MVLLSTAQITLTSRHLQIETSAFLSHAHPNAGVLVGGERFRIKPTYHPACPGLRWHCLTQLKKKCVRRVYLALCTYLCVWRWRCVWAWMCVFAERGMGVCRIRSQIEARPPPSCVQMKWRCETTWTPPTLPVVSLSCLIFFYAVASAGSLILEIKTLLQTVLSPFLSHNRICKSKTNTDWSWKLGWVLGCGGEMFMCLPTSGVRWHTTDYQLRWKVSYSRINGQLVE